MVRIVVLMIAGGDGGDMVIMVRMVVMILG